MKLSRGLSSGMTAFGRTKAPVDISKYQGLKVRMGLLAKTTFAKWVWYRHIGWGANNLHGSAKDECSKKSRFRNFAGSSLPLAICHQLPVEVDIVVR